MIQTIEKLQEIFLVGISARTNNKDEFNPETAKIGTVINKYFSESLSSKILNRKNPGTTYSVFTEYESDQNGNYTYFFGEEVTSFESIDESMVCLTIPAQDYAKFTNGPCSMPEASLQVWRKIWSSESKDFGGDRTYITDFEIYDDRAIDPLNTIVDIFVGIKRDEHF